MRAATWLHCATGAIQEGLAEDTEGIFGPAAPAKAHSVAEIKAHSAAEMQRPMRGFLASRS